MLLDVAVQHLLDEAALAHAALALDDGQDGPPLALSDPHGVDEEGQLELPAHERHRHAPPAPAGQGERLERQPGRRPLVPAPGLDAPDGLVGDGAVGGGVRRRPDQHAARRGRGLQPVGGVHHVAHGGVVAAGPQRADQHLAGVDADAHADAAGPRVGHELGERALHPQRGPHGPLGVVLVGHRRAEQGHDGVADDLVDPPAEARDVGDQPLEAARRPGS